MTNREYKTDQAFKTALEDRIRKVAKDVGWDMHRVRQLFLFDRFLVRVFAAFKERVILKGGVALELRLSQARTTRDVDLRVSGDTSNLIGQLRVAMKATAEDRLAFVVERNADHPKIDNDGVEYEGERFVVHASLAGKIYGSQFGTDVSIGDQVVGMIEPCPPSIVVKPILDFMGLTPAQGGLYPRESHVSEKFHAFTLPRARENSRVRDLPDIALLASVGALASSGLMSALQATFATRKTHDLPGLFPDPPKRWEAQYTSLAAENDLPWKTLDAVTDAARRFLEPVLEGKVGTWNPEKWEWT